MNRIESEASSLSGDLVVKEKSLAKRFWAYASSLLCVWFFVCEYMFYSASGFRGRGLSYWDSTLRVRIGQTGLSTSGLLFGAAIYCGIGAVVYFVFGIIVRRPFAIPCAYAHLCMSVKFLFSAASYMRRIVPSTPLEVLPGHFVAGFLSAQFFLLVYCVTGIFSAPPKNEYVRLT